LLVPKRRSAPATRDDGQRLWRVRRHQRTIDAELRTAAESEGGVELRYFYEGELIYSRTWRTRVLAEEEARSRLAELMRAGWATHW
jgi:hypothetical protein